MRNRWFEGISENTPTLTCLRVEMHFHNSDKLDLTANHCHNGWGRQGLMSVPPYREDLQRPPWAFTCYCVLCWLSGLILVKVWNCSDCKHLLFPAVTCYPLSCGKSWESLFLPVGTCQHSLNPKKADWALTCYTCRSGLQVIWHEGKTRRKGCKVVWDVKQLFLFFCFF